MDIITQFATLFFHASKDPVIWLSQVFVVVFLTVGSNRLLMRVLDSLKARFKKTASLWDDVILQAVRLPLRLVVWTLGLTAVLSVLENVFASTMFSLWPDIRRVSYIAILALFFSRFIHQAEVNIIDLNRANKPMDVTSARAVATLLRITVVAIAFLVILETVGYSISGVLAFGGMSGVAVGFAAKDMLSNFFGALMIYLDKPFLVGDWICSPDRKIDGTVEDIGWRLTRIRTFDKRPLYIPNSLFSNIAVENASRMQNRRIYETVGLRYDDAKVLKAVIDDVRLMLQTHPEIDQNSTMIVQFNGYGASELEFMVYVFTKTTEWLKFQAVKEDVLFKIMDVVEKHGAEFAFPTLTTHVASVPPELAGRVER